MTGFELPPTRNVRKDGSVHIPDEILEEVNLEVGEQVFVSAVDDGTVVIRRWNEDDIRESLDL